MQSRKGSNQQNLGSKQNFSQQIKNLTQNSWRNRYQIRLLIVMIIISITSSLQVNAINLFYANPVFSCQGLQGKISEQQACLHISTCQLINSEIATAKLELYCGPRTDERILIQTLPGIGSWLGIFFINAISDRKGRKFSIILSLVLLSIGCIITYIGVSTKTPSLLFFSQLLSGISGKPVYVNCLILSVRFFEKDIYEAVVIYWLIISGVAQMSIGFLNHYLQSVQSLILIYTVGVILTAILAFLWIYQDPLYYFDTRQYEKCKQVCTIISEQNGESADLIQQNTNKIETYARIRQQSLLKRSQSENNFNMYSLIRRDIIVTVLVLAILGCFLNMAINSLIYSIQALNLSFNDNLLIVGSSKIAGNLLAMWFLRIEQDRRRGFIYSSIMCGLAGIIFSFKFCRESGLAESIGIAVLKISLSVNSIFYIRLEFDTFPQKYQGFLIGCVEVINFGKILAPIMAQTSINYGLNPIVSINVIKLTLGTLPILLLKGQKIRMDDEQQKNKKQINQ